MSKGSSINPVVIPAFLALGLFSWAGMAPAAPAKPSIGKIVANDVARTLVVEGKAKMNVSIYDAVADQWLASQMPDSKGKFKFNLANLPTMPCAVRVEAEGVSSAPKVVKSLACVKGDLPPVCKIISPSSDKSILFKDSITFAGQASDPEGTSLHYEWDFGGGASARPMTLNANNIKFDAQDNTVYNVSFTVTDLNGRRCTDRMNVTVGTPPNLSTNKVPEQALKVGDPGYVLLPFSPYGMEFHDLSYGLYSMVTPTNWINAHVLEKGSVGTQKPKLLGPNDAEIQYTAASNPQDPVGKDSINSTSQNFPIGSTYGDADVRKSDWFDPCKVWTNANANTDNGHVVQYQRFFDVYLNQNPYAMRAPIASPGAGVVAGVSGNRTNAECNFASFFEQNWDDTLPAFNPSDPSTFAYVFLKGDAGAAYWPRELLKDVNWKWPWDVGFAGFQGVLSPNGSAMPGVTDPYQNNEPQKFSSSEMVFTGKNSPGFDATRNLFASVGLPLFPTDDKGRHNAYPLLRLQAHDKGGKLLGTSDAVAAVTTEMRCAECHTKGKNGADQAVFDALRADMNKRPLSPKLLKLITDRKGDSYDASKLDEYVAEISKWIPQFLAPEDINSARKNDRDIIEQASMINVARLHDFYYNFIKDSQWLGPLEFESEQVYGNAGDMHVEPGNCTDYCHKSVPRADPRVYSMAPLYAATGSCPELSNSLHNIHGRLMTTASGKFDAVAAPIVRDSETRELVLAELTSPDKTKQYLLSAKDAGSPDDSCYFCHAGKKDKFQRDVMTAAGVNCIDCHGDMAVLAGGSAMVSRDKGSDPLSSRDNIPVDLDAQIDKAKLASAYSSHQTSYGPQADGNYYLMELAENGLYYHMILGSDGKYKRDAVVTTLDMALNFLDGYTGVDNGNGTYTLTKKVDGQPDVVQTLTEAEMLDIKAIRNGVNNWNLTYTRQAWAQQPSCANCHVGEGDEAVRRRAYDMTTGQFRLLDAQNERFAENMLPKQHDSSFTLLVANGQKCPPGTFSDTVESGGNHVCERGLFRNSVDRHGLVSCEACHGPTHGVWPNPDPYANDNVTAMQLQGHTGTLLECETCHTKDAFKTEESIGSGMHYPDANGDPTILAGPHNTHPINDPYWYMTERGGSNPRLNKVDGSKKGGWHSVWSGKPGLNGEDQCAACHGKDHKGTRLSKTPVDRELTAGKAMKYKKVTVKAGTPIGCDLCHSLDQSFTLTPKK